VHSLNQIVSANARLALERAKKKAKEDKGERVSQLGIARKMVTRIHGQAGAGISERAHKSKTAAINRQLSFLLELPPGRTWRLDYLEAFAIEVGVKVEKLISSSPAFDLD